MKTLKILLVDDRSSTVLATVPAAAGHYVWAPEPDAAGPGGKSFAALAKEHNYKSA